MKTLFELIDLYIGQNGISEISYFLWENRFSLCVLINLIILLTLKMIILLKINMFLLKVRFIL